MFHVKQYCALGLVGARLMPDRILRTAALHFKRQIWPLPISTICSDLNFSGSSGRLGALRYGTFYLWGPGFRAIVIVSRM